MSPEQAAAFQTGAGYAIADLALVLMMVICTVTLLWNSWVLLVTYKGWANRSLTKESFSKGVLRVAALGCLILFLASL